MLGGKVNTPTPTGDVMLSVPKGANTEQCCGSRARGLPRPGSQGDQYVTLNVVLPDKPYPELEEFIARWTGQGL